MTWTGHLDNLRRKRTQESCLAFQSSLSSLLLSGVLCNVPFPPPTNSHPLLLDLTIPLLSDSSLHTISFRSMPVLGPIAILKGAFGSLWTQ